MKHRTRPMLNGDDLDTYNMGKKDDDCHNEIQLHKIKSQDHFIEAQVQEGDTLQAIALRFYCSIAELKRINHIHKDNEIFARRTIKVPVTPYSVLTELIPTQPAEPIPSTSKNTSNIAIHHTLSNGQSSVIQDLLSNRQSQQNNASVNQTTQIEDAECSIDCNTAIMNSNIAPSLVPYLDSETNEQATEDTLLLSNKEKESIETIVVNKLTSQSTDFGLKWFHLVCFMLILSVIVPLVYIMFYLKVEHPDLPPLRTNQ